VYPENHHPEVHQVPKTIKRLNFDVNHLHLGIAEASRALAFPRVGMKGRAMVVVFLLLIQVEIWDKEETSLAAVEPQAYIIN
jgi:hypothetical protein